MTLHMIGLGLAEKDDISVRGLETVKKCDVVYLESYTSKLNTTIEELEEFYGKKIIVADRELVEKQAEKTILTDALNKEVAFLVIGDVFAATTHIDLRLRAEELGIEVNVMHNASIVSAIGVTGLEVYKFGKVTSIPHNNEEVTSPVNNFRINQENGLHTLFLLDLDPLKDEFMTIKEAVTYLIKNGVNEEQLAIACAGIGSKKEEIVAEELRKLKDETFLMTPRCLIIPGNLHFKEEEMVELWKKTK